MSNPTKKGLIMMSSNSRAVRTKPLQCVAIFRALLLVINASLLARNISCFDPFRYCSQDNSLEYLNAVLVPKTNFFPFVHVLLH